MTTIEGMTDGVLTARVGDRDIPVSLAPELHDDETFYAAVGDTPLGVVSRRPDGLWAARPCDGEAGRFPTPEEATHLLAALAVVAGRL